MLKINSEPLIDVAASPSGRFLATCGKDRWLRLWRDEEGEDSLPERVRRPRETLLTALVFLSDEVLITGDDEQTVTLWAVSTTLYAVKKIKSCEGPWRICGDPLWGRPVLTPCGAPCFILTERRR